MAFENTRHGISREQCAKSVLPFLMATSVENTLNLTQFEQYMALIHRILGRVSSSRILITLSTKIYRLTVLLSFCRIISSEYEIFFFISETNV